ncbi:hypothetical protein CDAR_500961, partial [Caerostris darwini]
EEQVIMFPSPYSAAQNTHAIVVCTEWDEFLELDYKRIYDNDRCQNKSKAEWSDWKLHYIVQIIKN